MTTFEKLGVIKPLIRAVHEMGYETPTPIQERAIGAILAKKDVFATAQTGTGKTAAFSLPMLQKLNAHLKAHNYKDLSVKPIRGLIITPTRELATQISEEIEKYAKYLDLNHTLAVGGRSLDYQKRLINEGVDILIGTPGRIHELIKKEGLKLNHVEMFVVDEADRMLDMGFASQIRQIHPLLPKHHQTMLFSATYNERVRKLSKIILFKPDFMETSQKNAAAPSVEQYVYTVDTPRKAEALSYLIGSRNYQHVLIFTRTKKSADELAKHLELDGLKCGIIHGDKTQANRQKTLNAFKEQKIRVLVATDIASRGIDIEHLPQVINYELPDVLEDYVHRIGRTGRAGRIGEAITLLGAEEKHHMKEIEKMIKMRLAREVIEGFEPDPKLIRKDDDSLVQRKNPNQFKKAPSTPKRKPKKGTNKHRKTTKRDPR